MEVEELLNQYAAGERNFAGVNLTEAKLSGVNLSGANLSRANLSVANFSGANLSGANLSYAKLNVARLSGANLSGANLKRAILNVANLIRADFTGADLTGAALIRAELIRAELSKANLNSADLNGADFREARLRQANLSRANLNQANGRGSSFTEADLEGANLHGADLNRVDLSGANLRDADLRQANLSCGNLSGANLSGANLRWVDLSGGVLRWADLSEAKLSGANLMGADLSAANLQSASLVYGDLTQTRLLRADLTDADLSGAIITGAKIYGVSRFGLKTEGMICEWVDLSANGDRSQIQRFNSEEEAKRFFHQTLPTVQIIIDAPLDQEAHFTLAATYYQLSQQYSVLSQPPSIKVGRRRTLLTFAIDNETQLFSTAFVAILPFEDASQTKKTIIALMQMLQSPGSEKLEIKDFKVIQSLSKILSQTVSEVFEIQVLNTQLRAEKKKFFKAPTHTVLTNSSSQTFSLYHHPEFGKRLVKASSFNSPDTVTSIEPMQFALPPLSILVDFIKNFPTER